MLFKKSRFIFTVILATLLLIVAACTPDNDKATDTGEDSTALEFPTLTNYSFADEDIVATFDGGEVRGAEFKNYLLVQAFINPYTPINEVDYQRELLEYFIMEKWIKQVVLAESFDEADLDETVNDIMLQIFNQYDDKTRAEGFNSLNITEDQIKEYLYSYFIADHYFQNQVTESEIDAFYLTVLDEVTYSSVRHLLVATVETSADGMMTEIRTDEEAYQLAFDLYDRIQAGESFEELITTYTDDPGSKDSQGLYEDVPVIQWTDGFKEAVLEQEIGIIGYPVQTEFGYHIVKVEDRYVLELDEVREAIIGHLTAEKYLDFLDFELQFIILDVNL